MSFAEELKSSILKKAISGKLEQLCIADSNIKSYIRSHPCGADECEYLDTESIPEHWSVFAMKDLIELVSGVDLPGIALNTKGKGVPYITGASNIKDGTIDLNRWTEAATRQTKANDLLLVCKGSGVGKMAFCQYNNCHIARQLMAIRPLNENVSIHYIKIVLDLIIDRIRSKARSIIPGIDRKTILSLLVPIPSIEEQQRIVDRVDELMAKIDELEKIEKELDQLESGFADQLKASVLNHAISGKLEYHSKYETNQTFGIGYPSEWKELCIKDVVNKLVDGTHNPPPKISSVTPYKMLSAQNVSSSGLTGIETGRCVTEEDFKILDNRTRLTKGDFILTCVGTIGRSCILKNEIPNVTFQRSVSVMTPNEKISSQFLKLYFDSPPTQEFMVKNAKGTAQKGFYLKQVENLPIMVPSIEEQNRIIKKLEVIMPKIDELDKIVKP